MEMFAKSVGTLKKYMLSYCLHIADRFVQLPAGLHRHVKREKNIP